MKNFPTPRRRLEETKAPTEFDLLLTRKNTAILQLEDVRRQKEPNKMVVAALAVEAAGLEEQIAEIHVGSGRKEEAAINFISAASCWSEADKKTDALRALDRARELTTLQTLLRWIANREKQIRAR